MQRIVREPLLHFLLLGAALFAVFSFLRDDDAERQEQIVVAAGKIEHMAALFARTWQRPATREELDGLINDFIREEAAYREGLALGLDRDDTVIRRRIRQKLDFIAQDLAIQVEPTDAELSDYLAAHPDQFRTEPRLSFRQVYINPEQRRDGLDATIRGLMMTLNADTTTDASGLGDRIQLEPGYADVSPRDIANLFGTQFAAAIVDLEPGTWQGPIPSGYGVHLVIVDERRDGRVPALDAVRDAVRREWENARRQEMIEQFYRKLLEKYEIIVERPQAAAPEGNR
jgi:parvulin-like peptidyl-prolyl isomerase